LYTQEEIEAQAGLVESIGAMLQTAGWKEFVRLVEDRLVDETRSLISAESIDQVRKAQGLVNGLNWALELPKAEFNKLEEMRRYEASQNAKPE
jgi:homospermidine synthase